MLMDRRLPLLCLDLVCLRGVPLHQDNDVVRGLEESHVVRNTENHTELRKTRLLVSYREKH